MIYNSRYGRLQITLERKTVRLHELFVKIRLAEKLKDRRKLQLKLHSELLAIRNLLLQQLAEDWHSEAFSTKDPLYSQAMADIAQGLHSIQLKFSKLVRNKDEQPVISKLCSDGKLRSYELAYYMIMILTSAVSRATTNTTVAFAKANEYDLLVIRDLGKHQASSFCAAYEGKVFSISGRDQRFPAISKLPNGGPPFHPWCAKTFQIMFPKDVPADITDLVVSSELLLQSATDSVDRIKQAWETREG